MTQAVKSAPHRWLTAQGCLLGWLMLLVGMAANVVRGDADAVWEPDPAFDVRLEAAGQILAMASYTNGSVLIGGSFHQVGGAARSGCALLNADGSLVPEFVPDLGEAAQVNSIAVLPDQKVLVTGWFTLLPPRNRLNVVRLNPDGSLDESFELPSQWIYYQPTVSVMHDGQPLFGGALNAGKLHIFPLGPDGSPDSDFSYSASVSSVSSGPLSLVPDSAGRIYAAGAFRDFRIIGRNYLVRLRGDGSWDPTFFTGGGFDGPVVAVALAGEDGIFAGGYFQSFNAAPRPGVARLELDGSLDLDFKPREVTSAYVTSLMSTADGGVIVGGQCSITGETTPWGMIRLTRTGAVDRGFLRIPLPLGSGRGVAALTSGTDGRIWAGGLRLEETPQLPSPVLQIGSEPDQRESAGPKILRHGVATAIKPLPEGGLLIGGNFETVNSEFRPGLARILPTGSLDGGFAPREGRLNFVESLEVDREGRVYLGVPTGTDYWYQQKVQRLRSDGSVDSTYETLTLDSSVRDLFLESSGDLVVCGSSEPSAPGLGALVRLGPDGSTRSNAFPGSAGLFSTFAILPMTDGGVICGGNFGYFPQIPGPRYLARLTPDGTLDSTFRITNDHGEEQPLDSIVTSLTVDSQGRIVGGGWFQRVGVHELPGLVRIFPDGRLDPSFQPDFKGFNVDEVWVDSEDRLVARGDFFFSVQTPNRTVIRVLPDGTVDSTFPVITASVASIAVQGNSVFVSTGESHFPGDISGRLIRISPPPLKPSLEVRLDPATGEIELRTTPGSDIPLRLEVSTDLTTWTSMGPADSVTRVALSPANPAEYYRVVEAQ